MADPTPSMQGAAEYRIRVRGHLSDNWCDRLGGLSIRRWTSDDGAKTTDLTGRLEDQAALSGVLNALCALQMPVLSVECLD